jgi:hypothetical protein
MVAQYPMGGIAWDYLQYVIGLAYLGHDVFYYEDTWCWPYHPRENRMTDDPSYSAGFSKDFFQRYAPDLAEHWHYLHLHDASYGMSRHAFNALARTADLFINISGASAQIHSVDAARRPLRAFPAKAGIHCVPRMALNLEVQVLFGPQGAEPIAKSLPLA